MIIPVLLVTLCACYVGYDLYGVLGAVGVLSVVVGAVGYAEQRMD